MIRRFVNLVAENYRTGVYTLHRLDVNKHLFHQSRADATVVPLLEGGEVKKSFAAAAAAAGADELNRLKELPPPCIKIHPSFREELGFYKLPFWASLSPRSSEGKSLCINWIGDAMLCDAGKPSVDPMPHLQDEVGLYPISFSVSRPDAQEEEDLYVIHNVPQQGASSKSNSCFRVLRKDAAAGGWRWESLPPPPFLGDPRYTPSHFMYSHALVDGGRTICFSCATPGIGTYCFDTVEREWRHAGEWLLPFVGGAEYVPDLALWLGFSPCAPYHYLCGTSDLNVNAMSMDCPPKLDYVWQDLVTPEDWLAAGKIQVVSLGLGRFCIAKYFVVQNRRTDEFGDDFRELVDELVVLTGIELGRDDNQGLRVWKHKSMQCNSLHGVTGVL